MPETTVFILIFDIGNYLENYKKFFHKELQYPYHLENQSSNHGLLFFLEQGHLSRQSSSIILTTQTSNLNSNLTRTKYPLEANAKFRILKD